MLSAAKHLQCLVESKQMQNLRCARHDRVGGLFSVLLISSVEFRSCDTLLKDESISPSRLLVRATAHPDG
jgi:hypothetical protein